MIWLSLSCLSLMAGLYICAPLYQGESRSRGASLTVLLILLGGSLALYALLGRPDLTRPGALSFEADLERDGRARFTALTEELGQRLADNPDQAEGWLIYARSLMRLSRFDEAKMAYDTAYNQNPSEALRAEREQAYQYAADQGAIQPGQNIGTAIIGLEIAAPTQDQIEAAAQLDEATREAFILSMVDGLAARLELDPSDQDGWVRLLRALTVLGQDEKIAQHIAFLESHFADHPDVLSQIKTQAGLE